MAEEEARKRNLVPRFGRLKRSATSACAADTGTSTHASVVSTSKGTSSNSAFALGFCE